jgi:hypothetical protein
MRVARLDADKYEYLHTPEEIVAVLRGCDKQADLFTFLQPLPPTATAYPYRMEPDNLAALQVSTFDHWWIAQINNKTRNMVRSAEKKGVSVREVPLDDQLVDGIWAIYNECPVRQGKPFRHYGKDRDEVRRMTATYLERSVFIGAFLDRELIGFAKIVVDPLGVQAGLMHIVSMTRHRDKAPMNALVAQAVRACADRGIGFLVYSNFSYGNKQRDSLADFKQHNGFERIDLPRYYVPLTVAGRLALRLGLHRPLVHRVPESVMPYLRQVRARWHNRKLSAIAPRPAAPKQKVA